MRRTATIVAVVGALLALFAGAALAATIDGDRHDNRLVGTERADTIRGLGGNDTVHGRGGEDTLGGNSGNDTVRGGEGNDVLRMRDGVAGNDAARCGGGYDDVAYVDSRGEAPVRSTHGTALGEREDALCERAVYEAKAKGVLQPRGDLCIYYCDDGSTHQIRDEESGLGYQLKSDAVDLSAYEGRRVIASGWTTERPGNYRLMDVERIDFSELEPAARVSAD